MCVRAYVYEPYADTCANERPYAQAREVVRKLKKHRPRSTWFPGRAKHQAVRYTFLSAVSPHATNVVIGSAPLHPRDLLSLARDADVGAVLSLVPADEVRCTG